MRIDFSMVKTGVEAEIVLAGAALISLLPQLRCFFPG